MSHVIVMSPLDLEGLIKKALTEILQSTKQKDPLTAYSPEWLNVEEAAQLLKIPKSGVYQLTHRKHLSFSKVGRSLRFKKADLLDWLESSKRLVKNQFIHTKH